MCTVSISAYSTGDVVYRVFIAMVAGGIEIGRVNAFAPDYSKAKVAAAKLFALFDRKSLIDPTDQSGKRPVSVTSLHLRVHEQYFFRCLIRCDIL